MEPYFSKRAAIVNVQEHWLNQTETPEIFGTSKYEVVRGIVTGLG